MTMTLGFIGLGVMGEPICRNLAAKSGAHVIACDLRPEPLGRMAKAGVETSDRVIEVARRADLVLLSLPGGEQLSDVCRGPHGLMANGHCGQTVVDTGTSPVGLSRELAAQFESQGIDYADAPVARTRHAAEQGTLSIMVGARPEVFERIQPFLACCASDITHCGDVGSGQVVKLMNNMVVFQTVVALAEALTVARRAGVDGQLLLEALSKGSADSFALRNHGMKALLPGEFPERAFPTDYALKDLSYALDLASDAGLELFGAQTTRRLLEATSEAGFGARYFPALLNVVAG